MIIGIDPGQSGAIAAIEDGQVVALLDMPTSPRLHGQGQQVDAHTLATDFSNIMRLRDDPLSRTPVYLEAVSARPKEAASASFRFGESLGIVLGVLGALHMPVHWITPAVWKRRAGLRGKEKDAARTLAMQMHPEVANQLARKMDVGRADAILIARFGEKGK